MFRWTDTAETEVALNLTGDGVGANRRVIECMVQKRDNVKVECPATGHTDAGHEELVVRGDAAEGARGKVCGEGGGGEAEIAAGSGDAIGPVGDGCGVDYVHMGETMRKMRGRFLLIV